MRNAMNLRMHVCMCVVALVGIGGLALAGLEEAISAMDAGDGETAIKEFTKLAEQGDDKAMVTIGTIYHVGEIIGQDYGKAMEWYLKGVEKGNADALSNTGIMFRDGLGVPQDLEMAYALFRNAERLGRNGNTAMRVRGNLTELQGYISKEQIARAEEIMRSELTAARIRNHKPSAGAKRQKVNLLVEGWQKNIPGTYGIERPANAGTGRLVCLRNDTYDEIPGTLGFSTEREKDPSRCVKDGVYSNAAARIAMAIPVLSTGNITVHQTELSGGHSYMIRFSEGVVSELAPWDVDKGVWHAIVIATPLPEDWEGRSDDAYRRIDAQQKGFVSELPAEIRAYSVVTGSLGRAHQSVVLNRIVTELFPQGRAKVSPAANGLQTVGVTRALCCSNVVLEFAIVVFKPDNMKDTDMPAYAVKAMDRFMSGCRILPRSK